MRKWLLLVLIINLNSFGSYAQNELYGTWIVGCPIEFINQASLKHCGICPIKQDTKSCISLSDFEMTIAKDEITFNMNDTTTRVKYIWNSDNHTIQFTLKENNYVFKVLYNSGKNRHILKDEEGLLITLDQKK